MMFTWASRTDTGRVRDHNEDAVLPEPGAGIDSDSLIAAVADGMGGHAGGEIASRTAIETIAVIEGDPLMRVQAANIAVLDVATKQPRLSGMGTTVTMGIFEESRLRLGHVGDSRAYLLRQGELEQLTTDHSFVGEMIAAGRMTEEEAETHPYRSVVTRAVGLEPAIDVDAREVDLAVGDRILLCSDGVTSMLEDGRILEILGSGGHPGEAADELIAAANEAGGADNITAVVVDVA